VIDQGKIAGIITDGDLRRMLHTHDSFATLKACDVMSVNPKTIAQDAMVSDALDIMRANNITQLLVVNNGSYAGVIHLHDILKEGII